MGWRGAVRTIGAAMREAERNAQRTRRAQERYQAALEKSQQLEQAANAVEAYETYAAEIVSIHKTGSKPINWQALRSARPPTEPRPVDICENEAQARLDTYRPSFIDKIFRRQSKKTESLRSAVEAARREDADETARSMTAYKQALQDWEDDRELAEKLLASDGEAMLEFINSSGPFESVSLLGSAVSLSVTGVLRVEAVLQVHGQKVIPKEKISLLKSGKASVKALPKGDYFRLYQDYVCSAILRVARELFSILPLYDVVVTATEEAVSTQTGHLESRPIVSVYIPRQTFEKLALANIDPSDSMNNFLHEMSFKPNAGFSPVKQITAPPMKEPLASR